VAYPAYEETFREVIEAVELGDPRLSEGGIFILGESRSGKTTLLEDIADGYPRYEATDRTIIPCVRIAVPSVPSIKAICRKLLKAMGDPLADKGRRTNFDLTEALKTLLKGCGTRLLLLDELNNFVHKRGQDSTLDLSNWLKEITDEAEVLIVVAGLPISESVISGNEQLRRRFSTTRVLSMVEHSEKPDLSVFRSVLKAMDELLPLQQPSGLDGVDLSWRLYLATDALIGVVTKLLLRAVRIAHHAMAAFLTLEILAEAFRKEIWAGVGPGLNPFETSFAGRRLNHPGEPYGTLKSGKAGGRRK
jgi:hypothetical protein